MGTSTVSGPFRSQNGFQELVNGVWTPVGGGGGGGSSPTIIPVTPGGTTYTLPAFTEVGQTATFLWEFHYPDGNLTLTIAPMAGFDAVIFTGVEINFNSNSNIQDLNIATVTGTSTSASYIVASFSGIWEYGGNVYAIINLNVINTILAG
jgi:hypothetical protein